MKFRENVEMDGIFVKSYWEVFFVVLGRSRHIRSQNVPHATTASTSQHVTSKAIN
jgi:hypothetical protein